MSDLDLIQQLGDCLGHPLEEIPENLIEQYVQTEYTQNPADWPYANQKSIIRDYYSLSENGMVSGLFLHPVTSEILFSFPLHRLRHLKYLSIHDVNLPDFSFLGQMTELKSL
ncbi:MAG: hypothetical protein AAFQ89_08140, partial [Cyanobacteria bacterium J06626_18]